MRIYIHLSLFLNRISTNIQLLTSYTELGMGLYGGSSTQHVALPWITATGRWARTSTAEHRMYR